MFQVVEDWKLKVRANVLARCIVICNVNFKQPELGLNYCTICSKQQELNYADIEVGLAMIVRNDVKGFK
jgi:hypothetical protein